MAETINLKLKIWRQKNHSDRGTFELYDMPGVSTHTSFLEMMDVLNDRPHPEGKDPVVSDHDCREGICGMCSMYINGRAHGPLKGTTTRQLHYAPLLRRRNRSPSNPARRAFPVIRTWWSTAPPSIRSSPPAVISPPIPAMLPTPTRFRSRGEVGRSSLTRPPASAAAPAWPPARTLPAMLFLRAKSPTCALPQGRTRAPRTRAEDDHRPRRIRLRQLHPTPAPAKRECPKGISISHIARMNREYVRGRR